MPIAYNEYGERRRTLEGRPLYVCDNCGNLAPWNSNWAWFGSYKQLEDFGLENVSPVKTICSNACRVEMVTKGRLPADGLDDTGAIVDDEKPRARRVSR